MQLTVELANEQTELKMTIEDAAESTNVIELKFFTSILVSAVHVEQSQTNHYNIDQS